MKLRNLMWGACACAVMAGCSNDDVAENNGSNVLTNGGEAYVKVRIAMDNGIGSRATEGGYDYGTEEDHAITSIYFGFYKADGSWAAEGRQVGTTTTTPQEGNPAGNIDAISDAVVALELDEGDAFPTQVIAYVNIPNASTIFKDKSITEAKALTLSGSVNDETTGFPMTNSTYLSGGNEVIATAISNSDFYESEEAAKEGEHPVTIYVERLAAKITVANSEPTVEDINANGYTLTFEPEGYIINGTNTQEYYLKNIETSWGSWDWFNEESDYRCFWAKDPNYESMGETELDFCTYTEATAVGLGTPQYCMENTLTASLATAEDGGQFNAYTHLLLVGTYKVEDADGTPVNFGENEYLYMYAGTAYIKDDVKQYLLDAAADNELAWVKIDNTRYEQADANAYDIVRVGETNTVTLALKNDQTYYTQIDEDNYQEINDTEAYNTGLATYLTENIGAPEAFNQGKAYFATAIEHFGGTQSGDTTGEIGVVRNHSYVLTVTQISGLGEGVFDPEEDIIPTPVKKKYYVAATLNVLSWKAVTQEVSFN